MSVSSTGPMTSEQLKALADAPHGHALKEIRKFDPLYGRLSGEGELIKWRVKLTKEVQAVGFVTVEAATKEDAEALAEEVDDHKVEWDFDDDGCGFWVEEAKPV